MKYDSRLSSVLHLVIHMAEHREPVTSETLADYLGTNPVVVRRTLSGLREAGILRSGKGHGGGWTLERPLAEVTLHDIHTALGSPPFFAMANRSAEPRCLVEQAVNASLDETFREAEALLVTRLRSITLADLAADFAWRLKNHKPQEDRHHAV